ncbi:1-phosphatidylinositol 3-phosphate 5-kinase fab1 [Dermatophagoides farinae]|uniref:1-phosphatidylinositol 3-phosphate 5-kinase fab1 n=1 Tax=Dermatophagoides farinae TaxID=6954 RepID=UPI003F5E090E
MMDKSNNETNNLPVENDDLQMKNKRTTTMTTITTTGLIESVRRKFKSKDIGRQFWMPDSTSINCFDCATRFTTIRRRHHCRICGQIFCSNCCNEMIDSRLIDSRDSTSNNNTNSGLLRVCKYCSNRLQNLFTEKSKNNSNASNTDLRDQIHHRRKQSSSSENRKFSTSSIGDIVRFAKANFDNSDSVMIDLKKDHHHHHHHHRHSYQSSTPKNYRPSSAAAAVTSASFDSRFILNDELSISNDNNSLLSCSFDNVQILLDEIDETIDKREPIWVKEIDEEARLKKQANKFSFISEDKQNNNSIVNDQISHDNDDDDDDDVDEIRSSINYRSNDDDNNDKNVNDNHKIIVTDQYDNHYINDQLDSNDDKPPQSSNQSLFNDTLIYLDRFFDKNPFFTTTNQESKLENDQRNVSIEKIDKTELPILTMNYIYNNHSERILNQFLKDEKMSIDWHPILNTMAKQIADTIKLPQFLYLHSIDSYYQLNTDSSIISPSSNEICPYPMDIRKRVKIKSILNGSKNDCTIIQGLVFTKNVAHRKMRTNIDQPRILLFACSIGYDERRRSQPSSSSTSQFKLTLFDSMRLQETDYIANLVAKIELLRPDIIFVQGTVSQTALELLRQKQITVILNVKCSLLERISFFTKAELIHSPEMILNTTIVGGCQKFFLKDYQMSPDTQQQQQQQQQTRRRKIYFTNTKTLMFLEGCIENIGYSVILRGSTRFQDFKKLKKILRYMMFVHYNNRLEKAYHQSFNCMPIDERMINNNNNDDDDDGDGCVSLGQYYQMMIRSNNQTIRTNNNNSGHCNENLKKINVKSSSTLTTKMEKVSQLTIIEDFSDPLRSTVAATVTELDAQENQYNNNSGHNKMTNEPLIQMQLLSKKLAKFLDTIPLSSSPLIRFNLPFLMYENIHHISSLRFYYPFRLLPSKRLFEHDDKSGDVFIDDDDFANYSYLFDGKQSSSNDDDDYGSKNESSKLLFLNSLTSRYMIVKPHPFLINDDYDFNQKSQQYISDFRACGPYLRYAPDFFTRNNVRGQPPPQQQQQHSNSNSNNNHTMMMIDECLSNLEHQNISILFSVFSLQTETVFNYCLKPKILSINYYGNNDMSLGSFLFLHFFHRQSCFNQSSMINGQTMVVTNNFNHAQEMFENTVLFNNNNNNNMATNVGRKIFCPNDNCHISMFKHLMRFTHHNGTITVYLNKLNESRNVEMPHKILTWTYCTQCQSISEYTEMSADSLAISFGKFLELKFFGNQHFNYQKFFDDEDNDADVDAELDGNRKKKNLCRHSLHKESYQFFSYDQLVVIFKYEPIVIYEIVTPAPVIPVTRNHFSKTKMIDDLKQLTEQCHEVFAKIKNELEKIQLMIQNGMTTCSTAATTNTTTTSTSNTLSNNVETMNNLAKLEEFQLMQQKEELDFNRKIKEMHFQLSIPELNQANVLDLFNLENNVAFIKKLIAEIVRSWNDRFRELFQEDSFGGQSKKRNNIDNKFITSFVNRFLSNDLESKSNNDKNHVENENNNVDVSGKDDNLSSYFSDLNEIYDTNSIESSNVDNNQEKSPNKLSLLKNKMLSKVAPKSSSSSLLTTTTTTTQDNPDSSLSSSSFTSKIFNRNIDDMNVIIEMPFDNNNSSSNNKNVNKSNQMFEHYQLPTYKDVSIIVRDRDLGSIISYSLTTPEYEQKLSAIKSEMEAKSNVINESIKVTAETNEKNKMNDSQMTNNASMAMATATTNNKNEQTELNSTSCSNNNKTVAKNASLDQQHKQNQPQEKINQHIDIQFNDVNAKFYCCIYFAELFRKFRSLIMIDGGNSARYTIRDNNHQQHNHSSCSFSEDLYIYSLANCLPWNAIGGKSGSTFLKTRDERFILKEVLKGEVKHFLTFVSDYIDYCERTLLEKLPSTLVKVVGVYQISYKNTLNNKGSIHYILVMENLFYECNHVSYIYDLKGSMRNRKIDVASTYQSNNSNKNQDEDMNTNKMIDTDSSLNSTASNSDQIRSMDNSQTAITKTTTTTNMTTTSTVLLDENLRQISIAYPLYVHVHSKIFLMEAIDRDSEFLKNHCVMDYSLLVGFDEEHNEFVVGIIDYVRLFDWGKILESRVKKIANAIDPTVVHPSAYQKRFVDAINDYFTQVPDKWYPFMKLTPLTGKPFLPDDCKQQQQKSNCDINADNVYNQSIMKLKISST